MAPNCPVRSWVTPGTVLSDPILLLRIVGNLVSNAVKYTQRGGVLIASRTTGGERRIEVWDTGVGIAPVHQREIFREFFKVPSHTGTEDGFGLGLWIARRAVEASGGTLRVESEPGEGARFEVELPKRPPARQPAVR